PLPLVPRQRQKNNRRRPPPALGPGGKTRLGHGLPVGRRVHDRRRDGIHQDALLGHFFGERHGERRHSRLARRVGGHAGAAAPFERRARRHVDDAPAVLHRLHGGGPAPEAGGEGPVAPP